MKQRKSRVPVLGLLLALLLTLLPLQAVAAETEPGFYLTAETGSGLIFPPERVSYTDGQTIWQALEASGHTFRSSGAQITNIDGRNGNYTLSDNNGGWDLQKPARTITHLCFSERTDSRPSADRMALIGVLADYLLEPEDVRLSVKETYEAACTGFTQADDAACAAYAAALTQALEAYKQGQEHTYPVTFTGEAGTLVQAVSTYGKSYLDDNQDGVLELPDGTYTFTVQKGPFGVTGRVKVTGPQTVAAALPSGGWLDRSTLALSADYNSNDEPSAFDQAALSLTDGGDHRLKTVLPDAFTGTLYIYGEKTAAAPEGASFAAVYEDAFTGEQRTESLTFRSKVTGVSRVLSRGGRGNTLVLRVSAEGDGSYTQFEDWTVELNRVPTLQSLQLTDEKGTAIAATERFEPGKTDYTYQFVETVRTVTVEPVPLDPAYVVTVNGEALQSGKAQVPADSGDVKISVQAGAYETVYTLHLQPGAGRKISFETMEPGTTMVVTNSDGMVLPFVRELIGQDGRCRYHYTLVPGQTYQYVATNSRWYHAAGTFTMEKDANQTVEVHVETRDLVQNLAVGLAVRQQNVPLDQAFSAAIHAYEAVVPDTVGSAYLWAAQQNGVNCELHAIYRTITRSETFHDQEQNLKLTSGEKRGINLPSLFPFNSGYSNVVTVRASSYDKASGVTQYQDYQITVVRDLSLQELEVYCGSEKLQPVQTEPRHYRVTVPSAQQELLLKPLLREGSAKYGDSDDGYSVTFNGQPVEGQVSVPLNGTLEAETVELQVHCSHAPERVGVYTLQIQKAEPLLLQTAVEPGDGLVTLYEHQSGRRLWPENGTYPLAIGFSYDYTVTKNGYIGQNGIIEVQRDQEGSPLLLLDGELLPLAVEPDSGNRIGTASFRLIQAPVNQSLKQLPSQWSDFRGTEIPTGDGAADLTNNAVISAKTPIAADDGTLYWATKLGEDWNNAPGCPILVDGKLVVYAGAGLYQLDPMTGAVLARGQMCRPSSFAINTPTYAEGMIFVGLADGTVQAFNADTLESLWIYEDPLKGQPDCPITVRDGYLYTGFWNSEVKKANYICLPITDEDPGRTDERKTAAWTLTKEGGFYWAGACVREQYLLVGTDDGSDCSEGNAELLLLDCRTGAVLDRWSHLRGDVRSTVVYDPDTDAYYTASKGGVFYSVRVENGKMVNRWQLDLQVHAERESMCTSTPVVYNGRAYVGVSDGSHFSANDHNITVIDLQSRSIAYRAPTRGYCQTSGLLTTGYQAENGCVYVYFIENMSPGTLRVLRDRPNQQAADYVTTENGRELTYALFTPVGEQAQYAICSPIADANGTMYLKNDSGYLMAFGSRIERLEITKAPDQTTYAPGEQFDPAGMEVLAHYANGTVQNVTAAVKAAPASFDQPGEQTVTLSFPYVQYHNQQNGSGVTPGVPGTTPAVTLNVTVSGEGPALPGDADGNGEINAADAMRIMQCAARLPGKELALQAADVNGDGRNNSSDAVLVLQYAANIIQEFPKQP